VRSRGVSCASRSANQLRRRLDAHRRDLRDVFASDRHSEAFGLETLAPAGRARARRHVLLQLLLDVFALGLLIATLEDVEDAFELRVDVAGAPPAVAEGDRHIAVRAVHEGVELFGREVLQGRIEREAQPLGDARQHRCAPVGHLAVALDKGTQRALPYREAAVRRNQVGVELGLCAQPCAFGARTIRAVEREVAWLQLAQTDSAVGTGEMLGKVEFGIGRDGLSCNHRRVRHSKIIPAVGYNWLILPCA
jgi:hypothetical protein